MPPQKKATSATPPTDHQSPVLRTHSGKTFGVTCPVPKVVIVKPRPKPRLKWPSTPPTVPLTEDEEFENLFNIRKKRHLSEAHSLSEKSRSLAPSSPLLPSSPPANDNEDEDELAVAGQLDGLEQFEEDAYPEVGDLLVPTADEEDEEFYALTNADGYAPSQQEEDNSAQGHGAPLRDKAVHEGQDEVASEVDGEPGQGHEESDSHSNYSSDMRKKEAKIKAARERQDAVLRCEEDERQHELKAIASSKGAPRKKDTSKGAGSGGHKASNKGAQKRNVISDSRADKPSNTASKGELAAGSGEMSKQAPSIAIGPGDEDEEDSVDTTYGHTIYKGTLSDKACKECEELGVKVEEMARELAQKYGKSVHTIMSNAALVMAPTQRESHWNKHQLWYFVTYPLPKGGSESRPSLTLSILTLWAGDLSVHKDQQHAHYHALVKRGNEGDHWDAVDEYWVKTCSGADSGPKTAAGWVMSARDAFAKSAAAYSCTKNLHIMGFVIDIGTHEAAHQASGMFCGTKRMTEIINSHSVSVRGLIDWFATVLKYSSFAESSSVFPPLPQPGSGAAGNGNGNGGAGLMCIGKEGVPDRACHAAGIMLLQKLLDADVGYKYNFVTWKKLAALAAELHFTILNWSRKVPLPEDRFDFHKLDLSQLNELTGMFLHKKLRAIYVEEMCEAFRHEKKLRCQAKGKGKAVAGKPAAKDEDDEFNADHPLL
ncbi:hypothetical protein HYDPIDRAFT_26978 [Hydnomerulius pinastri MD-312]|nr:hypothetical protein HYDPIDRAFT_26978 [Hydnomerulius pinastri MD-312]